MTANRTCRRGSARLFFVPVRRGLCCRRRLRLFAATAAVCACAWPVVLLGAQTAAARTLRRGVADCPPPAGREPGAAPRVGGPGPEGGRAAGAEQGGGPAAQAEVPCGALQFSPGR